MPNFLTGKRILITGGTGSIGCAIIKNALENEAKLIKIFSNDENGLYETELEYSDRDDIDFIIGDIRDEKTVNLAVKNVDIIFHAAALKHVDRCESHPMEAVTTNIMGTNNIIKAAINENVKNVISISTDKAVNPVGVLGATKLLSEKLISAEVKHKHSTIFSSVRFGNVINTRGSVLPRIENQIKRGGPITLTDDKMKRFFMTKDQAVNLIISAAKMAKGGEIFVLKMSILRLTDLFDVMKELLAPKYGYVPSQIKTKVIGIKSGEKLIEDLLNSYEMSITLETKNFFIIPPPLYPRKMNDYPSSKKSKNLESYFKSLKPIDKNQILKMLEDIY